MSEESIKTLVTPDNSFAAKLTFTYNGWIGAKFEEKCFIQDADISLLIEISKFVYCLRIR